MKYSTFLLLLIIGIILSFGSIFTLSNEIVPNNNIDNHRNHHQHQHHRHHHRHNNNNNVESTTFSYTKSSSSSFSSTTKISSTTSSSSSSYSYSSSSKHQSNNNNNNNNQLPQQQKGEFIGDGNDNGNDKIITVLHSCKDNICETEYMVEGGETMVEENHYSYSSSKSQDGYTVNYSNNDGKETLSVQGPKEELTSKLTPDQRQWLLNEFRKEHQTKRNIK